MNIVEVGEGGNDSYLCLGNLVSNKNGREKSSSARSCSSGDRVMRSKLQPFQGGLNTLNLQRKICHCADGQQIDCVVVKRILRLVLHGGPLLCVPLARVFGPPKKHL